MVKPAMAYLDVVRAAAEISPVPVAAYQVSGEYAMISAAAANGWIDGRAAALETLTEHPACRCRHRAHLLGGRRRRLAGVTQPPSTPIGQPQALETPTRPEDVDTGFWLWVVAVPLMVTGYLVDVVTAPSRAPRSSSRSRRCSRSCSVAVVVTFLVLMRTGYRWARTVLTGGGLSSIFYAAQQPVHGASAPPPAAVIYAVTGIIGAVLIGGGISCCIARTARVLHPVTFEPAQTDR